MFFSDMGGILVANFLPLGMLFRGEEKERERWREGADEISEDQCYQRWLALSYPKLAQTLTCNCLGINDSPDRKSPVAFKWASVYSRSRRGSLLDPSEEISPPSPVRMSMSLFIQGDRVQSSEFMPHLFLQLHLFPTLYSLLLPMLAGTTAANLADISARLSGMSQAGHYSADW